MLVTRSTTPWARRSVASERVFANPDGEPVYNRVRIGFLGTSAVLIPVQVVETGDDEQSPRPQAGSPCIPRKLRTKRSGDLIWGEGLLLGGTSVCIAFVYPIRKEECVLATLSVLKFNDPDGADRVMIALQGMQEREMITLEDAAVVSWPQGNKKPKTRQLHSTAGAGAGWGAFWGSCSG